MKNNTYKKILILTIVIPILIIIFYPFSHKHCGAPYPERRIEILFVMTGPDHNIRECIAGWGDFKYSYFEYYFSKLAYRIQVGLY